MTKAIFHIAVAMLVSASAIAQDVRAPQQPENQGCNVEFAKFLVDQQVAEGRSVTETDKRIRILTRSADFVWKIDEPTAREYFTEAFKVATERFAEKGFERTNENGLTIQAQDHRFAVIRAIAKKDPEWAKRLSERLLKESEADAANRKDDWDKQREINDLMYLATESVKTSPELSWYLFRRIMRYPLDSHWYFALYAVAAADRKVADNLYSELLSRYVNETPRRLLFLSAYPFGNERIFGADKFSYGVSMPDSSTSNLVLQQKFLDTFFRRVASFSADPENVAKPPEQYMRPEPIYMVTALQEIEQYVVERFPLMMQRFSEARAQASAMLNDEMRKGIAEREKWNESLGRSFEQRIELLEKADSEGKLTDKMIVELVTWLANKTENQFKQIERWLDKILDEKLREGTISYFWFQRSELAIKENRLDDARRFSLKVPEQEFRAVLSFKIAEAQLKDLNEAASVYQTLAEVSRAAAQSPNSFTKARIHLGLAALYEKINHQFALDELGDAVKVINRLENPDILSTAIRRTLKGKEFTHFTIYGVPGYDMESTFKLLSKNDFDMPLSNARALEDKYLRTLAVIAVAQNCVDKPKPKTAKSK